MLTKAQERLEQRFRKLRDRHATQLRVTWDAWAQDRQCLYFHSFINQGGIKGNGAKALSAVCILADKLNIYIRCDCIVPKLFPYYERFGFVRLYSHDDYCSFHRQPKH
mgnify:CR=1 FL=1